jgi:hypothetical protein
MLVCESIAATVITALGPIGAHPSDAWLQGLPVVCAEAKLDMAAAITITLSLIAVFNLNFLGLLMCAPCNVSSPRVDGESNAMWGKNDRLYVAFCAVRNRTQGRRHFAQCGNAQRTFADGGRAGNAYARPDLARRNRDRRAG